MEVIKMKNKIILCILILSIVALVFSGCGGGNPVTPPPPETVSLSSHFELICISTGESVEGAEPFWEELIKNMDISIHMRPSLIPVGEDLQWLNRNTIYLNHPKNLKCLQDLEAKYPELLPLSYNELKSELEFYSLPLFYFSRDTKTGKIRGIIVADRVCPLLAEAMIKEGVVPLNVSFQYENVQCYDEDYDVQGLRVNADFKVDVGEWWPNVEMNTYWVPAVVLGNPDNTTQELLELKGQLEKAKEEINVLFEALAFMHLCTEPGIHNAKTQGENGINWEFPKPAEPAIRDETVNCASAANVIQYLLEDDYDEVGYVWRHTSFDSGDVGGHCTSYIKENGNYYFFDPVSLAEEDSHYPVEDGDGNFYEADLCDLIIQSTPRKYAIFWTQLSTGDEAIFAMFQSPYGHFALGSDGHNLYYPKAFDGANLEIWKDPADSVELLQASYSPEPPTNQYGVENYADYMPYANYENFDETEEQGEPEISTIPSDG